MAAKGFTPTLTNGDIALPAAPGVYGERINEEVMALWRRASLPRVRVASTANVVIATALENGDIIDGVTLATDDLVLLKNQTAPAENGIYQVVASGAASRASGFSSYFMYPGIVVSVEEGTVNDNTLYRCTSNRGGTLGVTALTFVVINTGSSGDVSGPASSVDGRIALFDSTTGKLLKQHTTGPGNMADFNLASQAEAEAGASNVTGMSPLRVAQEIAALQKGWIPLANFTASASSTIDFTHTALAAAWNGTYKKLRFHVIAATFSVDDRELWIRLATGTGGSLAFQTSNYEWLNQIIAKSDGVATQAQGVNDTKIIVGNTGANGSVGNASGESIDLVVEISDPSLTRFCLLTYWGSYRDPADQPRRIYGTANLESSTAITGLQFLPESGNLASGLFVMEGLRL